MDLAPTQEYCLHFTTRETEAEGGEVTCPRFRGEWVAVSGTELGSPDFLQDDAPSWAMLVE